MNLLIVDDIPSVVEGLRISINWGELGFEQVFPAYNTLEARAVLTREQIDVMLCDIQMPMETGLELFDWVRSQEMEVKTIFLTSHADFKYAQEALKLGGFDYIVQPAPYSEIFESVRRAVKELEEQRKIHKTAALGQVFRSQEDTLVSNAFRNLLGGNPNWENYRALEKLGLIPDREGTVYLALLQIQHGDVEKTWEPGLFNMALLNVLKEIFAPYSTAIVLSPMASGIYAICLPSGQLTDDLAERQLYFFSSVCRQYFECVVAVYLSGLTPLKEAAGIWNRLQVRCRENITLSSGVFYLEKQIRNTYMYRVPEIAQWAAFLKDGYPQALEKSAFALLDKMVESGKMNAKSLMMFQVDFVEMLNSVTDHKEGYIEHILNTGEKMEIFRNSAHSIEAMKRFIHLVAGCVEVEEEPFDTKTLVGRITRYINEHLDSELKRDDLAAYVNLSPDYMTRVFKKEMGITIKEYIIQQKMETARRLLQTTTLPVSFIAAKVGYCNFSHFSYTYKKEMGVTPLDERKTRE